MLQLPTATFLAVHSLLLLASLVPWATAAFCGPRILPEDACTLGGSLAVTSVPAGLPVDAKHCNLIYNKTDFQIQPEVRFPDALASQTYTLLMLDPDAPNRTAVQYYLHWIRANIPGEDLRDGNLERSTEITSFLGPAPPEGSGFHRYKFLVYAHRRSNQKVVDPVDDPERQFFNLNSWLSSLARQGIHLCGPLSGVQFKSGYYPAPPLALV